MKFIRKMVFIFVGLVVGWYTAGIVPIDESRLVLGPGVSYAEGDSHGSGNHHDAGGHHHEIDHGETANYSSKSDGGHEASGHHHGGEDHHEGADALAAGQLVPRSSDIVWFWPVLCAIACLFLGAVVLGIPILKLRGPEQPDPSDVHHDHDAH